MTDTNQTSTPAAQETSATTASAATTQPGTAEQGHCGGHHHCGRHADHHGGKTGCCGWKGHRGRKIIGVVALIALLGLMFGRCGHHEGHHMEGRYEHQQMESDGRSGDAPSLSTILDGIGATTEQRSKAVELFRK